MPYPIQIPTHLLMTRVHPRQPNLPHPRGRPAARAQPPRPSPPDALHEHPSLQLLHMLQTLHLPAPPRPYSLHSSEAIKTN